MAFGNGLTAWRTRSIASPISKGRFALGLKRPQAFLVDPPHDRFDVWLFDRQVVQRIAGGDLSDQLGGGRLQTVELQPTPRAIGAYLARTAHEQRTGDVLGQIDPQGAPPTRPGPNPVEW